MVRLRKIRGVDGVSVEYLKKAFQASQERSASLWKPYKEVQYQMDLEIVKRKDIIERLEQRGYFWDGGNGAWEERPCWDCSCGRKTYQGRRCMRCKCIKCIDCFRHENFESNVCNSCEGSEEHGHN